MMRLAGSISGHAHREGEGGRMMELCQRCADTTGCWKRPGTMGAIPGVAGPSGNGARVFLNAEFHAVWVLPDNELIDITSKPEGETRITFVSDESYRADFHHNKRPINRDCEESWT